MHELIEEADNATNFYQEMCEQDAPTEVIDNAEALLDKSIKNFVGFIDKCANTFEVVLAEEYEINPNRAQTLFDNYIIDIPKEKQNETKNEMVQKRYDDFQEAKSQMKLREEILAKIPIKSNQVAYDKARTRAYDNETIYENTKILVKNQATSHKGSTPENTLMFEEVIPSLSLVLEKLLLISSLLVPLLALKLIFDLFSIKTLQNNRYNIVVSLLIILPLLMVFINILSLAFLVNIL